MIWMFVSHPVAFICCLLSGLGLMGAYEWTGHGEPSDWMIFAVAVSAYLIAYVVLPWWTQPIALWRYWRSR